MKTVTNLTSSFFNFLPETLQQRHHLHHMLECSPFILCLLCNHHFAVFFLFSVEFIFWFTKLAGHWMNSWVHICQYIYDMFFTWRNQQRSVSDRAAVLSSFKAAFHKMTSHIFCHWLHDPDFRFEDSCYLLMSPPFFMPSGVTLMRECREWPGSIDQTSFSPAQTSGPWIPGWT